MAEEAGDVFHFTARVGWARASGAYPPRREVQDIMEVSHVVKAITSAIPGAGVHAETDGTTLQLATVFEEKTSTQAHRKVLSALSDAGLTEEFHVINLRWFNSRREWELAEAKKAIIRELEPSPGRAHGLDHVVHVGADHSTLTVEVEALNELPRGQVTRKLMAISGALLEFTGLRTFALRLPTPSSPYTAWAAGACDEDSWEDDFNPNWPSKKGNPSGGGRGNNPPRR